MTHSLRDADGFICVLKCIDTFRYVMQNKCDCCHVDVAQPGRLLSCSFSTNAAHSNGGDQNEVMNEGWQFKNVARYLLLQTSMSEKKSSSTFHAIKIVGKEKLFFLSLIAAVTSRAVEQGARGTSGQTHHFEVNFFCTLSHISLHIITIMYHWAEVNHGSRAAVDGGLRPRVGTFYIFRTTCMVF